MIVNLPACLLLLASPTLADAGLPSPSTPLRFEVGADLQQVLAGYSEATGQYLARAGKDELRRHRLTGALILTPDSGAARVEQLCRAAGLALWAEAHGEWNVLRVRAWSDLSLADARFVQVEQLWTLEPRSALPVSVTLTVSTLGDARLARSIQVPAGVQVLRPGGGQVGWNGLVLWGPAPEVAATARAFLAGEAPKFEPAPQEQLQQVRVTPTFGVEDEVVHPRRNDELLARRIVLAEGGRYRLSGAVGSVEGLLRAYELATWRPVTYLGGYAQRARLLSVPPFPRAILSQQELDHWVQAVLAVHDLVGQPAQRSGRLIRPIQRYTPVPRPIPVKPFTPLGRPTQTRWVPIVCRPGGNRDLIRVLAPHVAGMNLSRTEVVDGVEGILLVGPERGVGNVLAVINALNIATERGPALLAVQVDGDAVELARGALQRLHPRRNPAELELLPWFGEPLLGARGEEVLILAHPDQISLIAEEVRRLDE